VIIIFVCLIDCLQPHGQFFSYLEPVTITDDKAANLDVCLELIDLSSEGPFTATPAATRDLCF
jgi:hypothetical protein